MMYQPTQRGMPMGTERPMSRGGRNCSATASYDGFDTANPRFPLSRISPRPVPGPAMPNLIGAANMLLCERGDSNPQAFRRQILRLSPVAGRRKASRSTPLFRWVFGEDSRGVGRAGEPIAPSQVPPSPQPPRRPASRQWGEG